MTERRDYGITLFMIFLFLAWLLLPFHQQAKSKGWIGGKAGSTQMGWPTDHFHAARAHAHAAK